jgi:hypothetical protein
VSWSPDQAEFDRSQLVTFLGVQPPGSTSHTIVASSSIDVSPPWALLIGAKDSNPKNSEESGLTWTPILMDVEPIDGHPGTFQPTASFRVRGGLGVFTEGVKTSLPGNHEIATFMDA